MNSVEGIIARIGLLLNRYVNVKLKSGEIVMGLVRSETKKTIELAYPMLIQRAQMSNGVEIFDMTTGCPWFTHTDQKEVTIDKKETLFITNLNKESVNIYVKFLCKYEFPDLMIEASKDQAAETKTQPETKNPNSEDETKVVVDDYIKLMEENIKNDPPTGLVPDSEHSELKKEEKKDPEDGAEPITQ